MSLTNFSLEQFLNLKKKILRKINAISSILSDNNYLEKVQKYLVNENFNLYVGVITSILLVISNNSVFYIYIYIKITFSFSYFLNIFLWARVNLLADEFGAVGLLFDSAVAKIKKNIRKSIYY